MSQRDRFAKLKATKESPAPAPTPVDPTIDPVAAKIAARLMEQFSRPIATGEPTAPAPSAELSNTMSLDPQRFEDLKNLKEAESRAVVAEKKVENLEQSLEAVTTCLVDFT